MWVDTTAVLTAGSQVCMGIGELFLLLAAGIIVLLVPAAS
jgi:hypothetical protein